MYTFSAFITWPKLDNVITVNIHVKTDFRFAPISQIVLQITGKIRIFY